jgi:hypothetical protein
MSASLPTTRSTQLDQRHRTLLRTLHGRLFVTVEGRIFAVRGEPNAQKLRRCLAQQLHAPSAAEAPTPEQLGLELHDGEIPAAVWHAMSRAHQRWSDELDRESRCRPARRRADRLLASERAELRQLGARLQACAQWQRALQAGREPPGAPYLLSADTEAALEVTLAPAAGPCPPLVRWLARVVCWLAGQSAAGRFVQAVAPHLPALLDSRGDSRLRKFIDRLSAWRQRSLSEPSRPLQAELKLAIAALPPPIVQAGQLSARLRGQGFVEHCEQLLARCQVLLGRQSELIGSKLPATLAAWAASDGGVAPLPQRLIAPAMEKSGMQRLDKSLEFLAKEARQKGYDALLLAIDRLEPPADPREYSAIRELLVRGASQDDLAWCASQGLLRWLSTRRIQPRRLRCQIDELNRRNLALSPADHLLVADALHAPQGQSLLSLWLRWLDQTRSLARTLKLRQRIKRTFLRSLDWGVRQPDYADRMRLWFHPPACPEAGQLTAGLGDCARLAIERLAAYQQLSGKAVSLPHGVRNLLDERMSLQGECEFLRGRVAAGTATPAMRIRWERLESRLATSGNQAPERLVRAAEEALLITATETLPAIVRQAAEKKWLDLARVPALEMPLQRLLNLVDWTHSLQGPQLSLLRAILDAWKQHRADYKWHLPANQAWLKEAATRGWDMAAWLAPASREAQLGEQPMQIGASCDPRAIFHMGDYFQTCLSLNGAEQASVLANAHDANKHVIFLKAQGPTGPVLGRQLIAITSDGTLVGYHCYLAIDNKQTDLRSQALALMAEYCGRLARQCNLPLADQGKPAVLSGVDWWDDGTWAWHSAAREAGPARDVPRLETCFPFVADASASANYLSDQFSISLVS